MQKTKCVDAFDAFLSLWKEHLSDGNYLEKPGDDTG